VRPKIKLRSRDDVLRKSGTLLTPPDVGAAEVSSAMLIPTTTMKKLATAHWGTLIKDSYRAVRDVDPPPRPSPLDPHWEWNRKGPSCGRQRTRRRRKKRCKHSTDAIEGKSPTTLNATPNIFDLGSLTSELVNLENQG
jgi:hypothetical protein